MDEDLIQKARTVAEELLPAFDVLAAYAYGSRVSGTPCADSDLEVGYFTGTVPVCLCATSSRWRTG